MINIKNTTITFALLLWTCPISVFGQCHKVSETDSEPWIVFGSFRGGDFSSSVHRIRIDGSEECQLSMAPEGKPASLDPQISLDGTHIVFARGGSNHLTSVWYMRSDGSEEMLLARDIMRRFGNRASPTMLPDGQTVGYVRLLDGRTQIETIDLRSKEVTILFEGAQLRESCLRLRDESFLEPPPPLPTSPSVPDEL